ncbi:uncharacterized protein N7459_002850 [Penicillium hispanicum]|uniref:uncharacterized protein n=1 Tax=Penicillium hispanicum TaxID=1080232 RepID=UPI0025409B4C|nr:uncharacterized protein N7459_002850 [Penicillium hispanicum]KAJ5587085.1 hypothetical protein N7459_002850 [Penicillium hispanicum]
MSLAEMGHPIYVLGSEGWSLSDNTTEAGLLRASMTSEPLPSLVYANPPVASPCSIDGIHVDLDPDVETSICA